MNLFIKVSKESSWLKVFSGLTAWHFQINSLETILTANILKSWWTWNYKLVFKEMSILYEKDVYICHQQGKQNWLAFSQQNSHHEGIYLVTQVFQIVQATLIVLFYLDAIHIKNVKSRSAFWKCNQHLTSIDPNKDRHRSNKLYMSWQN